PALILEVRTAMEDLAAILSLPIVAQLAEK
ncbi:MAG: hypothetical protein K0S28_701, partial [Paucimonas sp.]|nr:hypothetical protein [Paucimonas sp.]